MCEAATFETARLEPAAADHPAVLAAARQVVRDLGIKEAKGRALARFDFTCGGE